MRDDTNARAWIEAHGGTDVGIAKAHDALAQGTLTGSLATAMRAYLESFDRESILEGEAEAAEQAVRNARSVEASAKAARESAFWAKWSMVIALAALLVATWNLVRA